MANYARSDFLDRKARSPVSLGAALAINGAIIGALLTMNPAMPGEMVTIIKAKHIPLPDPEPIPPPPRQKRAVIEQPAPKSAVTPSTPIVPTPPFEFGAVFPKDPPPPPGTGTIGTGNGSVAIDPPKQSVFIGPQIDTRYAAALQPPYPPGKIRAEEEGVVVVRVLIGPDGLVKQIEKVEGDEVFYRATASQATRRWRFKPATRDGVAVEGWRTMTIRFELNE